MKVYNYHNVHRRNWLAPVRGQDLAHMQRFCISLRANRKKMELFTKHAMRLSQKVREKKTMGINVFRDLGGEYLVS
jgi:hypothetical protein